MWAHLRGLALEADRKLVLFETAMGGAGEAFTRSFDAELGILDAQRRLVVDEAMGFRLHDHWGEWQIRL